MRLSLAHASMVTCALARCGAPRAPRLGVSTLPARSRHLPLAPSTRRRSVATTAAASDGGGTADDPWNKGPIDLDNRLYAYLLEHTREPEILRKLRVETATLRGSQMQVPPEQGALLRLIVELTGARRIIEVGTYTGYSSIAMALALPPAPDGLLVACDSSAPSLEVARRYWAEAGVSDVVDERLGDAKATLDDLIAESGGERTYDIGFVDADKRGYWEYYEKLLRLVRPGGLIAIDNVLWYGKVADPDVQDKQTAAIREFNAKVAADERVTHCTVPIGDGLTLCRVR